ncbi:MAG: excinuclease ABC subunit C [Cytophagales bacterium]|nr:MAG: excinuclease ABC subunit C [Cytophagales bacterium]
MLESLKETLKNLPHEPGVYKFFNKNHEIIYVGKAKNLKNRVSSYFNNAQQHSYKTLRLVSQIVQIEFTLVANELEALLLENNLIKNHQPRYNIMLKDGKTYPYLCLTKEHFPRLIVTRQLDRSQGAFFGPYPQVRAMQTLLSLIKELFPLRTCTLLLSQENIKARKFKLCLEYHIGNCKAPCENLQTEQEYDEQIAQIKQILKGNTQTVLQYFKQKMMQCAQELAFEKAEEYKQKFFTIEQFQAKSTVVNPNLHDIDVWAIVSNEENAFVSFMSVKNGAIIYTQNIEIKKKLDESDSEIFTFLLADFRAQGISKAEEVISNVAPNIDFEQLTLTIPKIGDKKKLLELALKNALFARKESIEKKLQIASRKQGYSLLKEMQEALRLPEIPTDIECFDNSNIQGTNPVAAMVHFKDGKPYKKEYRHFHIKTVEGANDFASMYEIITRRYQRLKEENKPLPQLIIIDGGKGQLSSACQALKDLDMYGKMPIIGIAKKLEEIYFPEDEIPIHLSKKSPVLKLIQRIRDETHRFAITFHRNTRSKNSLHTDLENIEGIGEKTIEAVLKHFKTISNIANANASDIEKIIGKAKAKLIIDYFQKKAAQ